jgi:hypothetical protein
VQTDIVAELKFLHSTNAPGSFRCSLLSVTRECLCAVKALSYNEALAIISEVRMICFCLLQIDSHSSLLHNQKLQTYSFAHCTRTTL